MFTTLRRVALALALVLPGMAFAGTPPTPERVSILMDWAGKVIGVPTSNVPAPRIVYASHAAIQVEFYGADVVREHGDRLVNIIAAYNGEAGYLLLDEDTDFTAPESEHILIHELTHYLQYVAGREKVVGCIRELERDAYRVSDLWVVATGEGDVADPLMVFLFSQCPMMER